MHMQEFSFDPKKFEEQWFALAEVVCQRIYNVPEVKAMKARIAGSGHLTLEESSDFISIANRVKYEVIYEMVGPKTSSTYAAFEQAWRNWFDHKTRTSEQLAGHKLTNAEHIVYSSTPDPEEFLLNS